jgi:hypothetical protein
MRETMTPDLHPVAQILEPPAPVVNPGDVIASNVTVSFEREVKRSAWKELRTIQMNSVRFVT